MQLPTYTPMPSDAVKTASAGTLTYHDFVKEAGFWSGVGALGSSFVNGVTGLGKMIGNGAAYAAGKVGEGAGWLGQQAGKATGWTGLQNAGKDLKYLGSDLAGEAAKDFGRTTLNSAAQGGAAVAGNNAVGRGLQSAGNAIQANEAAHPYLALTGNVAGGLVSAGPAALARQGAQMTGQMVAKGGLQAVAGRALQPGVKLVQGADKALQGARVVGGTAVRSGLDAAKFTASGARPVWNSAVNLANRVAPKLNGEVGGLRGWAERSLLGTNNQAAAQRLAARAANPAVAPAARPGIGAALRAERSMAAPVRNVQGAWQRSLATSRANAARIPTLAQANAAGLVRNSLGLRNVAGSAGLGAVQAMGIRGAAQAAETAGEIGQQAAGRMVAQGGQQKNPYATEQQGEGFTRRGAMNVANA